MFVCIFFSQRFLNLFIQKKLLKVNLDLLSRIKLVFMSSWKSLFKVLRVGMTGEMDELELLFELTLSSLESSSKAKFFYD